MIFCLSQLHVGTQTTLAWLCGHQEVEGMLLSTGVHKICGGLVDPAVISHDWESGSYHECFSRGMVYHEHLRCDRWNPFRINRTQLMMANYFPTIIPIRDPLAALISYQHRAEENPVPGHWHPDLHLFNRWVAMAEVYRHLREVGVQFLPWDLWDEDHPGIASIERHLGIRETLGVKVVHNNCSGLYRLRRAYLSGDVGELINELDTNTFRDLVERERFLRPMLEDLGYRKLLWWDR